MKNENANIYDTICFITIEIEDNNFLYRCLSVEAQSKIEKLLFIDKTIEISSLNKNSETNYFYKISLGLDSFLGICELVLDNKKIIGIKVFYVEEKPKKWYSTEILNILKKNYNFHTDFDKIIENDFKEFYIQK